MTKRKTATLKERNALFNILQNQLKYDQSVSICIGHTFERAAREFEAEGLVQIDTSRLDSGFFHVTRKF